MGASSFGPQPRPIWLKVGSFFLVLGIIALLYQMYDLKYPNHFVGDMYGLEVLFRLTLLGIPTVAMVIGAVLLIMGTRRKTIIMMKIGSVGVTASSVALIVMMGGVIHSRYIDDVRKSYQMKSAQELLTIAKGRRDQHAIEQLMIRRDSTAVPGLVSIVLDETLPANLRCVAAEALVRIDPDTARSTLDKAKGATTNETFRDSLDRMMRDARSGR